jgi:hypothetical protein
MLFATGLLVPYCFANDCLTHSAMSGTAAQNIDLNLSIQGSHSIFDAELFDIPAIPDFFGRRWL